MIHDNFFQGQGTTWSEKQGIIPNFASALNYAIIDIETTGGNAQTGRITEIAVFLHNGSKVIDSFSTLINPGVPIPPYIVQLTGISDELVSDAPPFEDIAKELNDFTANAIFVAHNAHFDYGFVREEFRRVGIEFKRKKLCTVQLSRSVFPGLASYSLDKITKELGIALEGHHRASADAKATALLFSKIIENQTPKGLFDAHFGIPPLENIKTPYITEDFLHSIPDETGVFRFYDAADNLIYSKKSNNVLSSICAKLQPQPTEAYAHLCKALHRIDYQLTGSQLVAQLLEFEDVVKEKPYFNHGKFSIKVHFAAVVKTIDGSPHLLLEKRARQQDIALVFSNYFEGKHHLEALSKRIGVPLKNIPNGKRSTVGIELPMESERLLSISSIEGDIIIVDEGRYATEHCRIFTHQGAILGYGYFDETYQFATNPLDDIQDRFLTLPEQEFAVRKHIEKRRYRDVLKRKDYSSESKAM